MLIPRYCQRGITLIELAIGITIFSALLAMAAPSFTAWIQNTHIRTATEAIQIGLQLARGEAVHRNTPVRFQFTTTLDNTCALTTSQANWVISLEDPSSKCATKPSNSDAPRIVQTRPAGEGSVNAVVAADQSTIVFNGLGRVTPLPASGGNININITNTKGGSCVADHGPMNCLRVVVSAGGQVRMCNPARSSSDPQGC